MPMKEHTSPLSRKIKAYIIPIIIVGIVSTCSYAFITRSRSYMSIHIKDDVRNSAALAVLQIEASEFEGIDSEDDLSDPKLKPLTDKLIAIQEALPNSEYVYIMRKTGDPMQLEFVAENDMLFSDEELDTDNNGIVDTDEEAVVPGELFDISEMPAMQQAAWEGPAVDPEITHDQWGSWISGYAPILDSNGKAVAILGIDIDANTFLSLSSLSLPPKALAVVVLAGSILLLYIFYITRRQYLEMLRRKHSEKHGQDLEVEVQKRTKDLEDAKVECEKQVVERTKELSEKVDELKKLNDLMIGRELKMKELKEEIENLKGNT